MAVVTKRVKTKETAPGVVAPQHRTRIGQAVRTSVALKGRKRNTDNLLVGHPSGKRHKALDRLSAAPPEQNYHPPEWLASSPRNSAGRTEEKRDGGSDRAAGESGASGSVSGPKMNHGENIRIFTLNVRGLRSCGKYEDLKAFLCDFKVL